MRYQVVGKNHRVFGKSHGEFFERNLPEAQERHLIGGGFIVRAPLPVEPSVTIGAQLSGFTSAFEATVSLPAEPSVSEDAPSEAPEEAPTDNPRRDEF
jgi:hypothetical protein